VYEPPSVDMVVSAAPVSGAGSCSGSSMCSTVTGSRLTGSVMMDLSSLPS
jgi:hypothetical protein